MSRLCETPVILPSILAAGNASKGAYQIRNTGVEGSQLKMLETLELSADEFAELKEQCENLKFILLSAFDEHSLVVMKDLLDAKSIKVHRGRLQISQCLLKLTEL